MQIQSKIPAFDDFSHVLAQADAFTSPSEIHGVLCGFVCTGRRINGEYWLDSLLKQLEAQVAPAAQRQKMVISLYDAAWRQLVSMDPQFNLLLPGEQRSLGERAEALSNWCQGFLYGLGVTGHLVEDLASEEAHEALRCMTELAKLDFNDIEVNEMDQIAYTGVVEYIRSAVMVLYSELSKGVGKKSHLH